MMLNTNPFVRGQGRAKFPYDYTWYMEDGSILQLAAKSAEIRPLRYDFNPNRWDSKSVFDRDVMSILRLMKNVVPTRIDAAIDVVGVDLGKHDFRDMKARKREVHSDGVGRTETIYIGSERSDTRLRIYNKKKERSDKGSDIGRDYEHWWRVEAQMRGEEAEKYLTINPFSDLIVSKIYQVDSSGITQDYDVRTRAMLYYLEQFPKAIEELAPNSRSKYKQLLSATKEAVSINSFADIYEENKDKLREIVDTFSNLAHQTFLREGTRNVPEDWQYGGKDWDKHFPDEGGKHNGDKNDDPVSE